MMLGMPVYQIMDEMPYTELQGWFKYLRVRPYGWRDDYRAWSIMSSVSMNGGKQKPEEVFESLKAVFDHQRSKKLKLAEGAVPQGVFLQSLLTAKGGDGHDFGKVMSNIGGDSNVRSESGDS